MKKLTFVRINDNFEPHIVVEKLTKVTETLIFDDHGRWRLTEWSDEEGKTFYSFGIKSSGTQPGHGGEWSSNSVAINEIFNVDITECAVRQINGDYPGNFAMAMNRKDIPVPYCLEWRSSWGSIYLLLKPGFEFPRSNNYFMSTTIDKDGNLLDPIDDNHVCIGNRELMHAIILNQK